MSAISTYASGTGQPTSGASPGSALTVDTEYVLDASTDINVAGEFGLYVDLNAMNANDVLEIRLYKMTIASGTSRAAQIWTFYGVPPAYGLIFFSGLFPNSLTDNNALKFTLKQTFGTGRQFVWSIVRKDVLAPTIPGRTLDVTATGAAGVDWSNVENPTTTVGLSGTTVKTATDVETDTANIQSRLPAALVSGRMSSDAVAISGSTAAADAVEANIGNLDAAVSTRLATAGYTAPDNTGIGVAAAAATSAAADAATAAGFGAPPSANANADALLDRANAIETGITVRGALRIGVASDAGKLSGAATTSIAIRDVADTKDRITATVDADGNRSATAVVTT